MTANRAQQHHTEHGEHDEDNDHHDQRHQSRVASTGLLTSSPGSQSQVYGVETPEHRSRPRRTTQRRSHRLRLLEGQITGAGAVARPATTTGRTGTAAKPSAAARAGAMPAGRIAGRGTGPTAILPRPFRVQLPVQPLDRLVDLIDLVGSIDVVEQTGTRDIVDQATAICMDDCGYRPVLGSNQGHAATTTTTTGLHHIIITHFLHCCKHLAQFACRDHWSTSGRTRQMRTVGPTLG